MIVLVSLLRVALHSSLESLTPNSIKGLFALPIRITDTQFTKLCYSSSPNDPWPRASRVCFRAPRLERFCSILERVIDLENPADDMESAPNG